MSGNETKPAGTQDGSQVEREPHHEKGNVPTKRTLSPALQELVDELEIDRELYEDCWTNQTLNLDESQKKDESGAQPYSEATNQGPPDDKKREDFKG